MRRQADKVSTRKWSYKQYRQEREKKRDDKRMSTVAQVKKVVAKGSGCTRAAACFALMCLGASPTRRTA